MEGESEEEEEEEDLHATSFDGVYPEQQRPSAGVQVVAVSSLDSLAHHLSLVGVVMAVGWGCKVATAAVAESASLPGVKTLGDVLDALPLFLWALFAAVLLQAMMDSSGRLRRLYPIDR